MSGFTDRQFEIVCDLAERAATRNFDGQEAVDMTSLPPLLEDLLAAARRGLETDEQPCEKPGSVPDMSNIPQQVNELGPENGRAICHWDAKVTEMGCEYTRPSETTGGES